MVLRLKEKHHASSLGLENSLRNTRLRKTLLVLVLGLTWRNLAITVTVSLSGSWIAVDVDGEHWDGGEVRICGDFIGLEVVKEQRNMGNCQQRPVQWTCFWLQAFFISSSLLMIICFIWYSLKTNKDPLVCVRKHGSKSFAHHSWLDSLYAASLWLIALMDNCSEQHCKGEEVRFFGYSGAQFSWGA